MQKVELSQPVLDALYKIVNLYRMNNDMVILNNLDMGKIRSLAYGKFYNKSDYQFLKGISEEYQTNVHHISLFVDYQYQQQLI